MPPRATRVILMALAPMVLAPQAVAAGDEIWQRVEEVLSGVAANYYRVPDADAMLRGALLAMTQVAPRAHFDATSHETQYRVRIGRAAVVSLAHPQELDEVVSGIVRVSEVLARRTAVSRENLVNAALRGAILSLDNCWTVYLTHEMVRHLSFGPGEVPGDVGLSLVCGSSGRVRHVRPSSPGFLAGIEPGDRVRAVDGRRCGDLDSAEIFALLSGRAGTPVRIGITRESGIDVTVELTRRARAVDKPRLRELVGGRVLYLRPGPMGERTTASIAPLLKCERREGIIMDLRTNEGGRVDEAERFASLFLDPGPIASIEGRGSRVLGRLAAPATGACAGVPLVLLVDRETASAAELIAQALRERRGATLIGQPTFGKGSVQQILQFDDGSVAKVTTARYLSPSGKPLDRSLTPDVLLPDSGLALGRGNDPTVDPAVRVAVMRLIPAGGRGGSSTGR